MAALALFGGAAAEDGSFLNETVVTNTLDPSPYLGIIGNADLGWTN